MKILIAGAGTVGTHLAGKLCEENHDVTVLDNNSNQLRLLQEYYDLQAIDADCTDALALRNAHVGDMDLVISVTDSDSVNVLTCMLAAKLGASKRIARIRTSGCFQDSSLMIPAELGIDQVIFPEHEIAQQIHELALHPYADEVYSFFDSTTEMVAVTLSERHRLVHVTMDQLPEFCSEPFRIVAIIREDKAVIPVNWNQAFAPGDKLYIVAQKEHLQEVIAELGFSTHPAHKIFIYGGTNIGINLARTLEESNVQLCIIEPSRAVTKQIAYELHKTLVLHGDGTDSKLLAGEGVADADIFVSVTSDENANLLAGLLAKKMGARKAIALVTKPDYVPLISQLNLDTILSERLITINRIMHLVRGGSIVSSVELLEGMVQALNFRVTSNTAAIGVQLGSLEFRKEFPKNAILGAVFREGKAQIPSGRFTLQLEDQVMVFCAKETITKLEKFFS
jgi:trk system potassium uptake protein